MKKIVNSKIFIFVIALMIGTVGILYAATIYQASDIAYTMDDDNVSLTEILNDLYDGKCEKYENVSKLKYNSSEILYTTSDGESMTVSEALDKIYDNKCNFLSNKVKLGDYISMTPTSTSFTTNTSKTGYTSSQTINPSELNLWRVIKINDDGTIEMVSEYVSSVDVYFQGQTGYQNLVSYLNVIASQYKNDKYTVSSRIIGYNGQTLYIKDTSKLTSKTAPWTCTTDESCNSDESLGGGDTLYTADTDLLDKAMGVELVPDSGIVWSGSGLTAYKVDTTTATSYWLGSRHYYYSNLYEMEGWGFSGRYISRSEYGTIVMYATLLDYAQIRVSFGQNGFSASSAGYAIRPILTLKSNLQATGLGTSEDPYVLP